MPEIPVLTGPGGRPLRVAHLTTVDVSLAKLLETELRVDVEAGLHTFGISAPGPYVPYVESLGVKHVPVPALTRSWEPGRDAQAAHGIYRALRDLRLDVLHTHNPKTGVLGRLIGRAVGVPVVVNTCHGLWAQHGDPLLRRTLVLTAEVVAAQASHAELYQNADDQAALSRWVPARRSRLVGNGTDLRAFHPDPGRREAVRSELGVGQDDLLVGGVGRRVAEKGIREFAEMARTLAGRARFVWVGPDDREKADALLDEVEGVTFVGGREDMPAVYNALDVFVLPSYREGFSRSGMEAAASGLPIVLSDVRGCREIGTHEREVLLVPPRDPAAVTAAVSRLLDDPGLRARLGAAARARALADFDQVEVAAASLTAYARVASARSLGWTVESRHLEGSIYA
jgi:glycosyltransferase involved in cell wall biosynthesis